MKDTKHISHKLRGRILSAAAAALLAVTLQGCHETEPQPVTEQVPVSVAAIGSHRTKGYVEGTTMADTPWDRLHDGMADGEKEPRTIRLTAWLQPQSGAEQEYFRNEVFAQNAGGETDGLWHHDPALYWPMAGHLDFLAYSSTIPFNDADITWHGGKSTDALELAVDRRYTQDDILFSFVRDRVAGNSDGHVPMVFDHAQAWIEFRVRSNVADVVTLRDLVLEDIYTSGLLTIDHPFATAEASWNFRLSRREDIPVDDTWGVKGGYLGTQTQYLDMLIPEQAQKSILVKYSLKGSPIILEHRYPLVEGATWLMGKKYIYDIMISPAEIKIAPSTVDWDSVPVEEVTIPHDYERDYLTMDIVTGGAVIWGKRAAATTGRTMEYSVNGGEWTSVTATTEGVQIPVAAGDKVRLRGTETTNYDASVRGIIDGTPGTTFKVLGNIMSMEYGDRFRGRTALQAANSFRMLFGNFNSSGNNEAVVDASNLILPAMTLTERCYFNMFQRDIAMAAAPKVLPAKELAPYCYYSMFFKCESLQKVPVLSALTLSESCYSNMFQECTALVEAPYLPATELAKNCYYAMFYKCSSLKKTQETLPAMVLAEGCYAHMFNRCANLEVAPVLPAPTLAKECYRAMFNAGTPEIDMKLRYIKMLATDVSAENALYVWCGGWANAATSEGTFIYSASLPAYGGWTVNSSNYDVPSRWKKVQE